MPRAADGWPTRCWRPSCRSDAQDRAWRAPFEENAPRGRRCSCGVQGAAGLQFGAAALQHAHGESSFLPRQRKAQRRRGGARAHAGTAPQRAPCAAVARGHLQPAQHALVVRGEPGERRAAFGRAKRLLERPQRILRRPARHDEKAGKIDACRRERGRVRLVRAARSTPRRAAAPADARARGA